LKIGINTFSFYSELFDWGYAFKNPKTDKRPNQNDYAPDYPIVLFVPIIVLCPCQTLRFHIITDKPESEINAYRQQN